MRSLFPLLCFCVALLASCGNQPSTKNPDQATTQAQSASPQKVAVFNESDGKLVTCENVEHDPAWRQNGPVIMHIPSAPSHLHPANRIEGIALEMLQHLHTFLWKPDITSLSYKAQLLKKAPEVSADGKTFTCILRDDAKWDNEKPITVHDVAFSFKINVSGHVMNADLRTGLQKIIRWTPLGDTAFQFELESAHLTMFPALANMPILQTSVYDPNDVWQPYDFITVKNMDSATENISNWAKQYQQQFGYKAESVAGGGAYRLDYMGDDKLVFMHKKDHWLGKTGPEELLYRITPDPNTQMLLLQNQEIDVIRDMSSSKMKALENEPSITDHYFLQMVPGYRSILLVPNLAKDNSPLNDPLVREAVAHALPIQEIIDQISNGTALPLSSFISVFKDEYHKELVRRRMDYEKVDSLLELAGWTDQDLDGIKEKMVDGEKQQLALTFVSQQSTLWRILGQFISESLGKAGFAIDLQFVEKSDYVNIYKSSREFDLLLMQISSGFGPDYPLGLLKSSQFPGGQNYAGYQNAKTDSLIQLVEVTMDYQKRKELLLDLQAHFYQELPYFFMLSGQKGILVHKRLAPFSIYAALPNIHLPELMHQPES